MFIKNWLSHFTKEEIDKSFWQKYRSTVAVYATKAGERSLLTKKAVVAFVEDQNDNFKYKLYIKSRENDKDIFYFPLQLKPLPQLIICPEDRTIVYELAIDPKLQISVVFPIHNEDYTDAGQFRNILCRLLYQMKHKKSAAEVKDQEILNSFIVQNNAADYSDRLIKLFEKMCKDKKYEFVGLGKFAQLDPNGSYTDPDVILPAGLFVITSKGGYQYDIEVIDENSDTYHNKEVSESLYYYFNDGNNSITWLDLKGGNMVCLNFEVERPSLENLKIAMSRVLMQNLQKESIESIIEKEKNNWDQYYLYADEDRDHDKNAEYDKYDDSGHFLDIEQEYSRPIHGPEYKNDIKDFVQCVTTQRAFINRSDIINVYKYDENEQNFIYLDNLPELSYNSRDVAPSKIQLQEQDSKLTFIDDNQNDKIFYYDVEKSKIINAFEPNKNTPIKDFSLQGGKTAHYATDSSILGVSENEIYRIDPRSKKPVVQSKSYKMDTGFAKIIGVRDNNLAIGSSNGDIRLYNDVGSNARNLIPSMLGDPVLHMDSSKDGSLLLLTFRRYLMIMPTYQHGKTAFERTFRKDAKPKPIILKVDPQILARFNMSEPSFVSAKFDFKKDQNETYIMAGCGNVLIIWNLSKVLNGNLVARNFLPMEDRIVDGEFLYNQSNIVTALPRDITVNKAKIEKI